MELVDIPEIAHRGAAMSVTISFPLTDAQATAIVIAAERFGVEAWEMAAHVLKIRTDLAASPGSTE